MKKNVPKQCPICKGELVLTAFKCHQCHTEIKGEFELDNFFNLDSEQLEFLKVFIKTRGNIKEVEKELGISYPTVRSKLETLIADLGYDIDQSPDNDVAEKRKEILDQLENGEIDVKKASELLKKV